MTRKQIMQKIEDYAKEIGIYSATIKRYDYDKGKYETYVVYKHTPEKSKQFVDFVASVDKEDILLGAKILTENQAKGNGMKV